MTIKGDDSKKDAVTRTEEEQEQVPSYQEAVQGGSSSSQQPEVAAASNSGKNHTTAPAQSSSQQQSNSMYPFPTISAPPQPGYGQSPYQPTGTLPIVIVRESDLLPLHATTPTRGPTAGRRFIFAFFWAVLLYMIMGAVTGALVQMSENSHQPKTPPGWHHHHKGPTQM
jgi:hypothetical protein